MLHRGSIIACVLSLSVALVAACGGDDETSSSSSAASTSGGSTSGCMDDPFMCVAGQTCWPSGSLAEPELECLNSGPGQIGDACVNVIGQPAWATWGAALAAPIATSVVRMTMGSFIRTG